MRILALESYYGGSHRAFLDGWRAHSQHEWDVFTLPPYKWKWRMRHAPITFAEQLNARFGGQPTKSVEAPKTAPSEWDVLFCTDMLNLAEFIGLAPTAVRNLPRCVLFHENQLTYPTQNEDQRDLHFAFSNITTALAADQVWFNSNFHQREFLEAAFDLAKRMPDFQPIDAIKAIESKSTVQPLGINPCESAKPAKQDDVLDILWAARWEHDKDPDTFFAAVRELKKTQTPFRLHVLGESFRNVPTIFETAKQEFVNQIVQWGYLESREEYLNAVAQSDVVVSTAQHEFLGLSVLEAMSAGVVPLLPERLSYPELLDIGNHEALASCLYDGSVESLAKCLTGFQRSLGTSVWETKQIQSRHATDRFHWAFVAPRLDNEILRLRRNDNPSDP